MKINQTNYMRGTTGKFKAIPWVWAKILTSVGMYTPCYLGGKRWTLDHVNYGKKGQNFSGYWVSDDGKSLIRISDYWSHKTNNSRIWSVKKQPYVVEVECPAKNKSKVTGGKIRFDKMAKKGE
jgi:hypothetical protein